MYLHDLATTELPIPPSLATPLLNPTRIACRGGAFYLQRLRLTAGARAGVELLLVDSGSVRAAICPTRGLGLWRANIDGIDYGWNSPVHGPVHPSFVPIDEPRGIGWLDGFDELLVRCGLRSFGAPDYDPAGRVAWPVHGRIANIPTEVVQLGLDEERSQLHVSAIVQEARFLQYSLQLHARYVFSLNEPAIEVHDIVNNSGGTATTMQLLYHINVGTPILNAGSKLHLAAPKIAARDRRAVEGLSDWSTYLGPTPGYAEQVYFCQPKPTDDGWATAMLANADGSQGFALHYDTGCLPYFSQWKNTVASEDGYVTGLEPGTGFPNTRSFEEEKGRLVQLQAGEERHFRMRLEGISNGERLQLLAQQIAAQLSAAPHLSEFAQEWCDPRPN